MKTRFLLIAILLSTGIWAQTQGSYTKRNFWHSGCEIEEANTAWQMSVLNNEVLISGSFEWFSASEVKKCQVKSSGILLKVVSSKFPENYGYIVLRPQINSSGEMGYQLTSRYEWSRLICDSSGKNCWSSVDAKQFWKGGFNVTDWILLKN